MFSLRSLATAAFGRGGGAKERVPFPGCIRFNVDGLGFTLKFPSFVYFLPTTET